MRFVVAKSSSFDILEAIAFAVSLQDVTAMCETVQDRSSESVRCRAPQSNSQTGGWSSTKTTAVETSVQTPGENLHS